MRRHGKQAAPAYQWRNDVTIASILGGDRSWFPLISMGFNGDFKLSFAATKLGDKHNITFYGSESLRLGPLRPTSALVLTDSCWYGSHRADPSGLKSISGWYYLHIGSFIWQFAFHVYWAKTKQSVNKSESPHIHSTQTSRVIMRSESLLMLKHWFMWISWR